MVDSGYPNRPSYLAPFKRTKYHLREYRNGPRPRGKKELFNRAHSSLRNVVERALGVLKMKWRILLNLPSFSPQKQSEIIVACMALHNFIQLSGLSDKHFQHCDRNVNYTPREAFYSQPNTGATSGSEDSGIMNVVREQIAAGLFSRV